MMPDFKSILSCVGTSSLSF